MKLEEFSKYLMKNNIELRDDGERAVYNNGKWAIGDGDWVNRRIIGSNISEIIEELEDFSNILDYPFNIPPSIKELLEVHSIESIANSIAFDICEYAYMKYVSYYDDNSMFIIDFFWEV